MILFNSEKVFATPWTQKNPLCGLQGGRLRLSTFKTPEDKSLWAIGLADMLHLHAGGVKIV